MFVQKGMQVWVRGDWADNVEDICQVYLWANYGFFANHIPQHMKKGSFCRGKKIISDAIGKGLFCKARCFFTQTK